MKKSLLSNFFFSAFYSLLNVIIPIILIPYVSRVLLPSGLGTVSFAQSIAAYFILLASLGIPNYGIREIAKTDGDLRKRSQVFYEIFIINLISTVVASILYYIFFLNLFPYARENKTLLIVVGISLLLNCCNVDWFYKGVEEFKYITVRSYIIKILAIIAVFIFVRKQEDIIIYALILTLSTSLNYIFNIIHIRRFIHKPKQKLELKKHLKSISLMFATVIAIEMYAQMDTTMLGIICDEERVGYYANPIKLSRIVAVVITSIGTIVLPRLSMEFQKGNKERINELVGKSVDYIILLAFPAMVGLFLMSEEVVYLLFGEAFAPSIITLKILSFLIPILAIGNIYGTQLMIASGLEKKLTITVIIGAVTNLTLNSILIYRFEQNGAAFASVIAELMVMLSQIILTKKVVTTKLTLKAQLKIIIQVAVMGITILLLKKMSCVLVIKVITEIIMAVTMFTVTGFLLHNELMIEIINKLKKRKNRM